MRIFWAILLAIIFIILSLTISFFLIELFDFRLHRSTKSVLIKIISFSSGGLGFIIGYFGKKEDFYPNKYLSSYMDSWDRYPYIHKSFLSIICIYILALILSRLPNIFMSSYTSKSIWITEQLSLDAYSWLSILIMLLSFYALTIWIFKKKRKENKKRKDKIRK